MKHLRKLSILCLRLAHVLKLPELSLQSSLDTPRQPIKVAAIVKIPFRYLGEFVEVSGKDLNDKDLLLRALTDMVVGSSM
jgi:hypothetical protein